MGDNFQHILYRVSKHVMDAKVSHGHARVWDIFSTIFCQDFGLNLNHKVTHAYGKRITDVTDVNVHIYMEQFSVTANW